MLDDPWAEAFEHGQHLVANSGTQKARIAIGRIDGMRQAVPGDVGVDVGPAGMQQRADAVAVGGGKGGQAARAGSPEDAHQDGLGPVVGVVTGGDAAGADT